MKARVTASLIVGIATLAACKRGRDSLGSFIENRAMLFASNCDRYLGDAGQENESVFRCVISYGDGPNCQCSASATLVRADNGKDARLLQIQVDHCSHGTATKPILDHLDWLLSKDDRAQLARDIDDPGHDAQPPASQASPGTISTRRIYGDRVVELEWSRDAYRQPDGSVAVQPTESYFVAIRPRTSADAPQVKVSKDSRVTAAPQCPH
jgi:hypothetical protein